MSKTRLTVAAAQMKFRPAMADNVACRLRLGRRRRHAV
jgi:hypothetical protein